MPQVCQNVIYTGHKNHIQIGILDSGWGFLPKPKSQFVENALDSFVLCDCFGTFGGILGT